MLYQKATVENGQVKITESKVINQATLTSDCWLVQFNGIEACETCEVKGTNECGGGETLKAILKKQKR